MTASAPSTHQNGFTLGPTREDVEEFQAILREECGEVVDLPEAWARATEVLALFAYSLGQSSGQSGLELHPDP